jgi:tetratricopeptide (TPR) repeat protein
MDARSLTPCVYAIILDQSNVHEMLERNAKPSIDERIAQRYGDLLVEALADPLDASAAMAQTAAAAGALFQAGVLRHKLLLITDILERFDEDKTLADPGNVFFEQSAARVSCALPDVERYYRLALTLFPTFAEARYNLATLRQRAGAVDEALQLFSSAAEAPPRALPSAQLTANALWHIATIHRILGQDDAAAGAYRRAVAQLGNFGVDHSSVAKFLRRRGSVDEAALHFERIMPYSHLYAPEFVEPDYTKGERLPNGPDGRPCDPLTATPLDVIKGVGRVVYWWHLYILEPNDAPLATAEALVGNWVAMGSARRRLLGLWGKLHGHSATLCAATSLDGLKKLL